MNINSIILFLFLLCGIVNNIHAQDSTKIVFPRGESIFKLSASYFNNKSITYTDAKIKIPPISLEYDICFEENAFCSFGAGGYLKYGQLESNHKYYHQTIFGSIISIHKNIFNDTDIYLTGRIGFDFARVFQPPTDEKITDFDYGICLGLNKMFSPKFGFFIEGGWYSTFLSAGFIYRPSGVSKYQMFYGATPKY